VIILQRFEDLIFSFRRFNKEANMLERYETFVSEQYRRRDEQNYAETHRLAKANGLQVSYYRKLACDLLIRSGERLVSLGKRLQPPIKGAPRVLVARSK
jgi:hypothetical protein